jgi:hypothetical protein
VRKAITVGHLLGVAGSSEGGTGAVGAGGVGVLLTGHGRDELLGATAFLGRGVKAGPLEDTIGSTRLFAIPSPSRRNAHYGKDRILRYFKDLAYFMNTAAGRKARNE